MPKSVWPKRRRDRREIGSGSRQNRSGSSSEAVGVNATSEYSQQGVCGVWLCGLGKGYLCGGSCRPRALCTLFCSPIPHPPALFPLFCPPISKSMSMWTIVRRVVGLSPPTIPAGASGVVRALRRMLSTLGSSLPEVLLRWWSPRLTQAAVALPQPQPRYFALFKPYMVLCSWESDAPCKNGRAPRTTLADLGLPSGVPHGYRAFSGLPCLA